MFVYLFLFVFVCGVFGCDNYSAVREDMHGGFGGGVNISICTQVRNDCHLVYGWVMFHYLQGVNKFHIYLIDPSDCTEDVLSDFVKRGIVELHYFPEDAFEYTSNFSLCEEDRSSSSNIRVYMGKNVCDNYTTFIDECKLSLKQFDNTLSNEHRFSCQLSSMYDCFRRHERHDGLLGMIDVDEYIFPRWSNMSLVEAFDRSPQKDIYVIEGLLYGMTKQYRKQMPYELLPVLHKRHIQSDEWVEEKFHERDGIVYRNYARKSFYRMPTVLRVDKLYIENHELFYKGLYDWNKTHRYHPQRGLVFYNHYMYKSLEEYVLNSILDNRLERQVDSRQLGIFEEEHGSRMETFLTSFQRFFNRCEVPKIKALLQPKTTENDQWWVYHAKPPVTEPPTPSPPYGTFVVVLLSIVVFTAAVFWRVKDRRVVVDEHNDEETIPLTETSIQ